MEPNKFISSTHAELMRSQIILAEYNPRTISPSAEKMLRKNIKRVGLMGGLIWNKTTGNLVSGHQRVKQLDILKKYNPDDPTTDYSLPVDMVEMSLKEEMQQNILLNNRNVQGDFDLAMLKPMIEVIDYELAGFDDYDLNLIGVDKMSFEEPALMEEYESDLHETLRPVREQRAAEKELKKELSDEEKTQAVKDMKGQIKAKAAEKMENMDAYFMVTFDTYAQKAAFLHRLGVDPTLRFIKGDFLANSVEVIG